MAVLKAVWGGTGHDHYVYIGSATGGVEGSIKHRIKDHVMGESTLLFRSRRLRLSPPKEFRVLLTCDTGGRTLTWNRDEKLRLRRLCVLSEAILTSWLCEDARSPFKVQHLFWSDSNPQYVGFSQAYPLSWDENMGWPDIFTGKTAMSGQEAKVCKPIGTEQRPSSLEKDTPANLNLMENIDNRARAQMLEEIDAHSQTLKTRLDTSGSQHDQVAQKLRQELEISRQKSEKLEQENQKLRKENKVLCEEVSSTLVAQMTRTTLVANHGIQKMTQLLQEASTSPGLHLEKHLEIACQARELGCLFTAQEALLDTLLDAYTQRRMTHIRITSGVAGYQLEPISYSLLEASETCIEVFDQEVALACQISNLMKSREDVLDDSLYTTSSLMLPTVDLSTACSSRICKLLLKRRGNSHLLHYEERQIDFRTATLSDVAVLSLHTLSTSERKLRFRLHPRLLSWESLQDWLAMMGKWLYKINNRMLYLNRILKGREMYRSSTRDGQKRSDMENKVETPIPNATETCHDFHGSDAEVMESAQSPDSRMTIATADSTTNPRLLKGLLATNILEATEISIDVCDQSNVLSRKIVELIRVRLDNHADQGSAETSLDRAIESMLHVRDLQFACFGRLRGVLKIRSQAGPWPLDKADFRTASWFDVIDDVGRKSDKCSYAFAAMVDSLKAQYLKRLGVRRKSGPICSRQWLFNLLSGTKISYIST